MASGWWPWHGAGHDVVLLVSYGMSDIRHKGRYDKISRHIQVEVGGYYFLATTEKMAGKMFGDEHVAVTASTCR